MQKRFSFFLSILLAFSSACQLLPASRAGTVISACSSIVQAVNNLQPVQIPDHLLTTGKKRGDEFDVNHYFNTLTHLSMREGYALDYVYQIDGLGGYPLLYAHPVQQAPYASTPGIPEGTEWVDFKEYLEVEDIEQGYFEYVVMALLANQFYLAWHANYNDTQIICNRQQLYDVVQQISSGDFGYAMEAEQQAKARTLRNIPPVVQLTEDTAVVEIVTFTKWGGFYRQTYTIQRDSPPRMLEVKRENILPYDCGIVF